MTAATEFRHSPPHRVLLESKDSTILIQEMGRRMMLVLVVPPERTIESLATALSRFSQAAAKELG